MEFTPSPIYSPNLWRDPIFLCSYNKIEKKKRAADNTTNSENNKIASLFLRSKRINE